MSRGGHCAALELSDAFPDSRRNGTHLGRVRTPAPTAQKPAAAIAQTQRPGQFESLSAAPSNSWWFETPDGGLVIFDAQRTLSDARALVVGDVLTPRRVSFMAAAETAAWLKQIAVLRATYDPGTRVAHGHCPETTLKDAADWQAGYLTKFRELVAAAVDPGSADGACVAKAEAKGILIEMRRTYPTTDSVARMPPDDLEALNIEGVSYELSGKACPGVENPVR